MLPLPKQTLPVPFAGVDQKNDPFKISSGRFLSLENVIFEKGGPFGILLQKRNGFPALPSLPVDGLNFYTYLSTFNNNLIATGTSLAAYSPTSSSWVTKGYITHLKLETLPLIRSSSNQTQVDTAISSNGFVCTVYTNSSPSTTYNYAIADSTTGQNIVAPTAISSPSESPRVFVLGNYFIILFSQAGNLKYISVPFNNPSSPSSATTLVTNYAIGGTQLAFDGVVSNNNLYVSYNASDGGGAIRMTYLNSFLVRQTAATGVNIANAKSADMISVCSDSASASSIIWTSFYKTAGTTGYVVAVDTQLTSVLAATQIIAAGTILNITSTAFSGAVTVFYEVSTVYTYGAGLATNVVNKISVTQAGSVLPVVLIARSVGLASKAFLFNGPGVTGFGTSYVLVSYSSSYQPSYFLIEYAAGVPNVIAKLAYSNGGGYLTLGLPSVTVTDGVAQLGYLIKDLIVATNKSQSPTSSTPVFTQTGINLVSFNLTSDGLNSSEIGANLHFSGGILWAYDGYQITEQGFNLYPDNVIVTTNAAGGNLKDQTYYYVALYEWTDNQGNIQRSAPSLPVKQITAGGNTSTNTIKVPTLRLTYKSLVKIVLYRWSTDNQTYYQVTSLTSPTLNSITADNVTITDTLADASIVGNSILYTTGGVVEDIGPPATIAMTIFKNRLFLIDAEDQNLLWYSKQVIEATPVEFSDLFTLFVAPSIGSTGSTGAMKCLFPMDDKLIIFKKNALFYLVGDGPDNTGANNDFSEPVFINSTVGSENHNSIVFIPNGLMFESDKGIWLLGRDLSTSYIGKDVEDYTNEGSVLSAIAIPGTNQVRFTLDSGVTLMYDYFFGQWCAFTGIEGISSTIYQGVHTFINSDGMAFQESAGTYLDGANPVLMSFKTGWFNLAGLQGFQRAYFFYFLGTYLSPHILNMQIAYDYAPPSQVIQFTPDNFSAAYGGDSLYGGSAVFGGPLNVEQGRVFFKKQKCEAFQITLQENYDPSLGVAAGAGLSLSGINLVVSAKKSYPTLKASRSIG